MESCFFLASGAPGPRFRVAEARGHKKAFGLPRGEETKAGRSPGGRRRDSTPILSLARQSPGPHGPGLDERKKAGLLTSGSSYWLRLTAISRSGLMELSSPVTAALPHRIHTCFPILPGLVRGTFWRGAMRVNARRFQRTGVCLRREGGDVKRFDRKGRCYTTCITLWSKPPRARLIMPLPGIWIRPMMDNKLLLPNEWASMRPFRSG